MFASIFPLDPRKDRDDQNESYVSEELEEEAKLYGSCPELGCLGVISEW